MTEKRLSPSLFFILPLGVALLALTLWAVVTRLGVFPESAFPSPMQVADGFVEEIQRGRLADCIIVSIFRVSTGFALAVILGLPLGLAIGLHQRLRIALLPAINFFRSLSPLAWIPFAILWFGIGDKPAIFLIFLTSFFPVVLATSAGVAGIPTVYFRVARDHGMRGVEMLTQVILPAIMPQVITALRVTAGLSWVVVVAAEMIDGRVGLGYMITDARNVLRPDLVVVGMIVIGVIGVALDRILAQLTRIPSVRWGYDK